MDHVPAAHPTDRALSAFGIGKLDARSAEAVDRHLEECAACRERVAEMSADSFLARMRDARPEDRVRDSRSHPSGMGKLAGSDVSLPPAAETLPPGLADHPDYEIKRELGRGGMGVVYLARNKLMGRDDALKVMGRHIVERPRVVERFLREIRAVAKLRHPNIVAAYHATRIGQNIVLAMEYVEGLDLARIVAASGPLSIAHSCNLIYQTALGLQHAHEEELVHRDVKPSNLMLSSNGVKQAVKILDFGLAKATREEKLSGGLTWEGQALGTPDFIAPEQIMDAPSVDIRADIYSLGGSLYYLLTGRPPFQASCVYDLYQAHISRDADPLNLVRPEVPTELAALVGKMMAKDPSRRFQTPGEVAQALTPFFMKGAQPFQGPKPDISLGGEPAVDRLMASTGSLPAQPEARADRAVVQREQAARQEVTETRWDTLIAIHDTERLPGLAPTVLAPTRRTSRTRLGLTTAVLTLALSGAWLGISLNDVPPGSVMTPKIKPRDSTGSRRSGKAREKFRSEANSKASRPQAASDQSWERVAATSKNELASSDRGDAEDKPASDPNAPKVPSVAEKGPPGEAVAVDPKPETGGPVGGAPLPNSIVLVSPMFMLDPRSARTKADRTRILSDLNQTQPAENKLEVAKARYGGAKLRANKKLLDAFEIAIRNVDSQTAIGAVGRMTLRAQLEKERDAFINDQRTLPNTTQMLKPVIDYLVSIVNERVPLSNAYEELVALYERTDKPKATQLALEADKLERELWDPQPLDKHSLWEGSLSGKVEQMPLSLRILERQEMDFEAEVLFKGGFVKAGAKGQFDGLRISFSTEQIPNEGAVVYWSFRGIVWRGWVIGGFEERTTDAFGDPILSDRGQIRLQLKR
jgi:serine/threonine protein kinase